MTTETGIRQEVIITDMTQFVFVRLDSDGSVWARIDPKTNVATSGTGSLRLNGIKHTITSHTFTQIYPTV